MGWVQLLELERDYFRGLEREREREREREMKLKKKFKNLVNSVNIHNYYSNNTYLYYFGLSN